MKFAFEKRFFAMTLALVMVFAFVSASVLTVGAETAVWDGTAAKGFAGGAGTEKDPYLIKTAEQLKYFADRVNEKHDSFKGKYIRLGADIVLNGTVNWEKWETKAPKNEWTAIGRCDIYSMEEDLYYPFSGTFDGAGHTVSGIYINTVEYDQGLFGYTENAVIGNVGVQKSYIKGGLNTGGVVGVNKASDGGKAIVENCRNAGNVSGIAQNVGGVVGRNDASDQGNAAVRNCSNEGGVSASDYAVGGVVGMNTAYSGTAEVTGCTDTGKVSGREKVGGIVGESNAAESGKAIVSDCRNEGTVSASDSYAGGVVGHNNAFYGGNATVKNCCNDGIMDGMCRDLGGVVGWNDASDNSTAAVTDCFNTGDLRKKGNYGEAIGGVAGSNTGTVTGCYNAGDVSGEQRAGGVAGVNSGTVGNCYNTGAVSSGDYCAGGVAGSNAGTVNGCYNTGEVTGRNGTAGGICGSNESGTVSNCYNTGTVSGCGNLGGIVGANFASEAGKGKVINCYNTGKVIGLGIMGGFCYCVGGVVGGNHDTGNGILGTVGDCYYLAGCAKDGEKAQSGIGILSDGQVTSDASGKTKGLTEAQMKKKESFSGFDFGKIWAIGKVKGYDYPALQWQIVPEIPKGDIGGDGRVNAQDCLVLKSYILKTMKYATTEQIARMDVSGDGTVNAVDYALLRAVVLGKKTL